MRTTRVTYAVERLKKRSNNLNYKVISQSNGLFYLIETKQGQRQTISPALPMDEFIAFIEQLSPIADKSLSKNELAFQEKIKQAEKKT